MWTPLPPPPDRQSNMALPMGNTFSTFELAAQVKAGAYANLRIFKYGDMAESFPADNPVFVTTTGSAAWYNVTHAAAMPYPSPIVENPFGKFSATCMYFGTALTDQLGTKAPPIGLIQSAVGGTQIEAWLDNSSLLGGEACAKQSGYNLNASGFNKGYGLSSKRERAPSSFLAVTAVLFVRPCAA